MTGLKKGTLKYEGMSPDRSWTITSPQGVIYDVWEIFSEILPELDFIRVYVGKEYIFLKRRRQYSDVGEKLNEEQVERFLSGRSVTDTYINRIIFLFDYILRILNNKPIRLHSDFSQFCIISAESFEHLKSVDKSTTLGLHMDPYGFCRADSKHRKNVCRIGEKDQCIYVTSLFVKSSTGNHYIEKHLCGKFSKEFSPERLSKFEAKKLGSMTKRTCGPPRGIEI